MEYKEKYNNLSIEELFKILPPFFVHKGEILCMKMFKGNRGYTFFYESENNGTPNISDYSLKKSLLKVINYLDEHDWLKESENILQDMIDCR